MQSTRLRKVVEILEKQKIRKYFEYYFFTILRNFNKCRGRGTGEAGEARASPEFRGFTTEKFLAS